MIGFDANLNENSHVQSQSVIATQQIANDLADMPIGLEVLEERSNEDMSPQFRKKRALMMKCSSSPTMDGIVDDTTYQASL